VLGRRLLRRRKCARAGGGPKVALTYNVCTERNSLVAKLALLLLYNALEVTRLYSTTLKLLTILHYITLHNTRDA